MWVWCYIIYIYSPRPPCPSSQDIHIDIIKIITNTNLPVLSLSSSDQTDLNHTETGMFSQFFSFLWLTQLQALHILFLFYSLEQVVKYSKSNFISFSQGIVFNSFCRKYKIPGLICCLAQLDHNISLMYIRQTFGKNFAYNDFSYFWCFKNLIHNDEKFN